MVETRNSRLKRKHDQDPTKALKRTAVELAPKLTKHEHLTNDSNASEEVKSKELGLSEIHAKLLSKASKQKATILTKYFRVEEYGEGDILLGVKVPDVRSLSNGLGFLPYSILKELIQSKYHEERLLAVINVVTKFKNTQDPAELAEIFRFYVEQMREGVNNWDLVDSSASQIVGEFLKDKSDIKRLWLYDKLAVSERIWDRRIAIVSTQCFIKNGKYDDTLKLAEIFLNDAEDLIHKATGWTLREMGKKSKSTLVKFLNQHAHRMPRVMLRYSLEKFSEEERRKYMIIGKK
ncbi:DNA alkylation repair enzyme-domain-containing protein [Gigaspora rosea]|uniref:DNA alkylation repair enzyme-domain-containing protein n=1 Tax=Gigaspora rosea TaxID=44941 RepID=A0A397VSF8_9GLOM|nr:DNA alkylation repair enzyme-domain-containing protein [Gigaspora rosea]